MAEVCYDKDATMINCLDSDNQTYRLAHINESNPLNKNILTIILGSTEKTMKVFTSSKVQCLLQSSLTRGITNKPLPLKLLYSN